MTLARLPSLEPSDTTESFGVSALTSGRRVEELELCVELELELVLFREVEVETVELELEARVELDEDGAAELDELDDVVDDEEDGAVVEEEVEGAAEDDELGEGEAELDGAAELLGSGVVDVLLGASVLGGGLQVLVGSGLQVEVGSSFVDEGLGSSLCCCSPPEEPPPDPSFQVQDIWKRPTSLLLNFSKREGDMSSEPWAQPGHRSTTVAVCDLPPKVIVSDLPQCAPPSHMGAFSATTISLSLLPCQRFVHVSSSTPPVPPHATSQLIRQIRGSPRGAAHGRSNRQAGRWRSSNTHL